METNKRLIENIRYLYDCHARVLELRFLKKINLRSHFYTRINGIISLYGYTANITIFSALIYIRVYYYILFPKILSTLSHNIV